MGKEKLIYFGDSEICDYIAKISKQRRKGM